MGKLLQQVQADLQRALELELFTLPPYLTALYSIHENTNEAGRDAIQSVAMEEMLHIILVANIMNAIGAKPTLFTNVERYFYPSKIPHIDTGHKEVQLCGFSKEALKHFMDIEKPDYDPHTASHSNQLDTIGEFYETIMKGLIRLCPDKAAENKLFSGDRSLQIPPDHYYYGAGGKTISVTNLTTAIEALEEIAEQGEGRKDVSNVSGNKAKFGQPKERAHYYRFREIFYAREYIQDTNIEDIPKGPRIDVNFDFVYPMQISPTATNVPADARAGFDVCYGSLLKNLEKGLNGNHAALDVAISDMHALRHHVVNLMHIPKKNSNKTLGPPFWFVKKKV